VTRGGRKTSKGLREGENRGSATKKKKRSPPTDSRWQSQQRVLTRICRGGAPRDKRGWSPGFPWNRVLVNEGTRQVWQGGFYFQATRAGLRETEKEGIPRLGKNDGLVRKRLHMSGTWVISNPRGREAKLLSEVPNPPGPSPHGTTRAGTAIPVM